MAAKAASPRAKGTWVELTKDKSSVWSLSLELQATAFPSPLLNINIKQWPTTNYLSLK